MDYTLIAIVAPEAEGESFLTVEAALPKGALIWNALMPESQGTSGLVVAFAEAGAALHRKIQRTRSAGHGGEFRNHPAKEKDHG